MTKSPHTELPTHPTLESDDGIEPWTPTKRMSDAEAQRFIAVIHARMAESRAARLRKGRLQPPKTTKPPQIPVLTPRTGKDGAKRPEGATDAERTA